MVFGLFSGNKKSQTTNQTSNTTNSNLAVEAGGLGISNTDSGSVNVELSDSGAIEAASNIAQGALFSNLEVVTAGFDLADRSTGRAAEVAQSASAQVAEAYQDANRSEAVTALLDSQKTFRTLLLASAGVAAIYFAGKAFK